MRALVTGVYGQDGSYLCEQLYERGYEVHGICRNTLSETSNRIKAELEAEGKLPIEHFTSLYDYADIEKLISDLQPDEIYHMAAIHNSAESVNNNIAQREYQLLKSNVSATYNILSACSLVSPQSKIVTAGSCLMYDNSDTEVQNEDTLFESDSMYGIAKITEQQLVKYYRHRGVFACMAILYNHESHRRGEQFVTRKISKGLRDIANGKIDTLTLGGLDSVKDWGYAGDYTEGLQRMLTSDKPKDYILATGKLHTIRDYVEECAKQLNINDWNTRIEIDSAIISRKVKGTLCGCSDRIRLELGWKPKTRFESLVAEMITDGGRIDV